MRTLLACALLGLTLPLVHAPRLRAQGQQPAANSNTPGYVLKVQSDLVLTNVVVRDKRTGAVVQGLTDRKSVV